jgi:hypothetical protein
MRGRFGVSGGIGDCHGQANLPHHAHISEIVTHKTTFISRHRRLRKNCFQGNQFGLRVLMDELNL